MTTVTTKQAFTAGLILLAWSQKKIKTPKLHYALAKNQRIFAPILEDYETTRTMICKKWGTLKKELGTSGQYEFPTDEAKASFEADIKALQEQDVELAAYKIKYSWLVAEGTESFPPSEVAELLDVAIEVDGEPE